MVASSVSIMSSTTTTVSVPAMQVPAELGRVLDSADYESLAYVGDLDLLATIEQIVHRQAQLQALLLAGLAEVERRDAAVAQHGVVTPTWLAGATNAFSFRDSKRLVEQAVALDRRFVTTDTAMRAGRVSPDQADAMVRTLTNLPPELSTDEVESAEATMLGLAETYGPQELRQLTNHLVDVVAPQVGEAKLAESLRKQEADAQRDRIPVRRRRSPREPGDPRQGADPRRTRTPGGHRRAGQEATHRRRWSRRRAVFQAQE